MFPPRAKTLSGDLGKSASGLMCGIFSLTAVSSDQKFFYVLPITVPII